MISPSTWFLINFYNVYYVKVYKKEPQQQTNRNIWRKPFDSVDVLIIHMREILIPFRISHRAPFF